MASSHNTLKIIFTAQILKSIRMKQLLMFFVGYVFGQMEQICKQEENLSIAGQEISMQNTLKYIYTRLDQNSRFSKSDLLSLFLIVLRLLSSTYSQSSVRQRDKRNLFICAFQRLMVKGIQLKLKNSNRIDGQIVLQTQLRAILLTISGQQTRNEQQFEHKQRKSQEQVQSTAINHKLQTKQLAQSSTNKYYDNLSKRQPIPIPILLQESDDSCQICSLLFHKQKQEDFPNSQLQQTQKIVTIQSCGHMYHQHCLKQMIKYYMNNNPERVRLLQTEHRQKLTITENQDLTVTTQIKCPNHDQCSEYFTLRDVYHILQSQKEKSHILRKQTDYSLQKQLSSHKKYIATAQKQDLLGKFYSLTFKNYLISKNTSSFNSLANFIKTDQNQNHNQNNIYFYCHTPGCNAVFELSPEMQDKLFSQLVNISEQSQLQNFVCPSCKRHFCLKCFASIHPTMTCKQYSISSNFLKEDEQFQKFLTTLRKPYKKCPKCHFFVDNWRGCSTIKCRCGTQFCYKCGNVGCPHGKCLKEMQKQAKQKESK